MVKVIKFRVKNYKSIQDSRDCYLAKGITVLAGKNESGKTSILEALEDFDTDKKIRPENIPLHNTALKPEVTVTFEVDKEELQEMHKGLNIDKAKNEVTLTKNLDNNYTLINSDEIFSNTYKENEKRLKNFETNLNSIKKLLEKHSISVNVDLLNEDNFSNVSSQVSKLRQNLEQQLSKFDDEEKAKIEECIVALNQIVNDFVDTKNLETEFVNEFKKFIPNFILFDTYNDQIPNKVPISQLKNNDFIKDLAAISDLDLGLLQDPAKVRENLKHKNKVNIKVSEEYKKFWEQDAANLSLEWDKENLYFWIKENEEYFEPKQRSKGRQWHLAFYVRVTARSREDVPNVILVDEPGLFLHAKAQKDILRKLAESSENMAIIFSTHSPYLIDPNHLNRVRLVEKSEDAGTKISKIHAKADKETLTPILTAIGEDLSQGIRVDRKNSFIVEGISDYYYIHAFAKLLQFNKEINLIPGCGDNMPAVAAILFGWGLDPYFILDSDKQRLINTLKSKLDISDDVIIKVSKNSNSAIEEILSPDDFKKLILEDENADLSKGIIKFLKENGVGKELLAKKFLEKVNSKSIIKNSLSGDSIKNIEALFEKISGLVNHERDN